MTLADYLDKPGHTASALALATGVTVSTITRAAGGSVPSPALMKSIFEKTNGEVTPNDFYGIQPQNGRRTPKVAA